jgi:ABC-type branched-subunit amino acid transport system ATPase component
MATTDTTEPLLKVREVSRRFGGVYALRGVSLDVPPAKVVGLLGANGSGKTTMLNVISGAHRPTSGEIEYRGKRIEGKAPDAVASLGIARTFQQAMTFPGISVRENLRVVTRERARIAEVSERFGLTKYLDMLAGSLSHGTQRLLGVALALLTSPALLLLDEPAAGLNRTEAASLSGLIRRIRQQGTTVLLVEHHMDVVMTVCDTITVLNYGRKLAQGTPLQIQQSAEVVEAYLGHGDELPGEDRHAVA